MSYIKKNAAQAGLNLCKGEKMEENQDLQDIVLDRDDDNGGSKARKIITTVISLIILFLIVIIVVKFVNSGDEEEPMTNNTGSLILPEEPVAPAPVPETTYEQVPIEVEPMPAPEPTKEPNEPRAANEPTKIELEPTKPMTELKDEPRAVLKQEVKQESKKQEAPKAQKTEPKKEQPKASKPEQKMRAAAPSSTNTASSTSAASSTSTASKAGSVPAGTYVQVSSLNKVDENNPLFKKLKNAGYSYKTFETTVNGKNTTKVLVGPFNANEVKEKLSKIKADITSNAFIYKVK